MSFDSLRERKKRSRFAHEGGEEEVHEEWKVMKHGHRVFKLHHHPFHPKQALAPTTLPPATMWLRPTPPPLWRASSQEQRGPWRSYGELVAELKHHLHHHLLCSKPSPFSILFYSLRSRGLRTRKKSTQRREHEDGDPAILYPRDKENKGADQQRSCHHLLELGVVS